MKESYAIPIITDKLIADQTKFAVDISTIAPIVDKGIPGESGGRGFIAEPEPHKKFVLSDALQKDLTSFCQTICDALDDIGNTKSYELEKLDFSVAVNAEGKLSILSVFNLGASAGTTINLSFKKKESGSHT